MPDILPGILPEGPIRKRATQRPQPTTKSVIEDIADIQNWLTLTREGYTFTQSDKKEISASIRSVREYTDHRSLVKFEENFEKWMNAVEEGKDESPHKRRTYEFWDDVKTLVAQYLDRK